MVRAIEYGIDKFGRRVEPKEAISKEEYICPYCYDDIHVRKGSKRSAYYAHNKQQCRTPLQRTCPGYTGKEGVSHQVDKFYINNGGLPLYLLKDRNEMFYLEARFPNISPTSYDILVQNEAKLIIEEKLVKNISSYMNFRISAFTPWVNIQCHPEHLDLPEVKRKWLWGVRGIDIHQDIFHSHLDGGYRVALGATLYVNKTYRIIIKQQNLVPQLKSTKFEKVGYILLEKQLYNVYEMTIYVMSDEAKEFCQQKGYRLQPLQDKVTPLWPPVTYRGSDIYSNADEIFFSYENNNNLPLYKVGFDGMNQVSHNKKHTLLKINNDYFGHTIAVSAEDEQIPPAIRFNIIRPVEEIKIKKIEPEIKIIDDKRNKIELEGVSCSLPNSLYLTVDSNLPVEVKVLKKNYILNSNTLKIQNLDFGLTLAYRAKGGSMKVIKFQEREVNNFPSEENVVQDIYYKFLYFSGPTVPYSKELQELYYFLRNKAVNKNSYQVCQIIGFWIKNKKIPISALKYLDNLNWREYRRRINE